jgi:hypothetical protein
MIPHIYGYEGSVFMRLQLQKLLEERVLQCVNGQRGKNQCQKINRKKDSLTKRAAEIVKAKAEGKITYKKEQDELTEVHYSVHFQYLIRQEGLLYKEEEIEQRKAKFYKNSIIEDIELEPIFGTGIEPNSTKQLDLALNPFKATQTDAGNEPFITIKASGNHHPGASFEEEYPNDERLSYTYNRLKAIQYAEKWWNSYNPAYKKFENDCTSFISQCLHQGGAPMRGYPNRRSGWWMRGQNYSISWAVAHSLMLHLRGSKTGLRAKEVTSPDQLLYGDVICYDFQGNDRFDHNTIVTGKDAYGMPLVNAHTYNSRMRYWAYEDSSAYTPNIKYKFLAIVDGD